MRSVLAFYVPTLDVITLAAAVLLICVIWGMGCGLCLQREEDRRD